MNKTPTRLMLPPPDEDHQFQEVRSGTYYEIDRYLKPALDVLSDLPLDDMLQLIGVSYEDLDEHVITLKDRLCRQALVYLETEWEWTATGEKVEIDDDFVEEFLDQDVVVRTVHRRLEDRRMTLAQVGTIIDFFESEELKPITKQSKLWQP